MRYWLPALLLLAAALPAQADTYKWVDEKGVTNYSSTPPSTKVKPAMVEDRVSVVATDPSWKEAAAISAARPDYATEEWLQRQRLMALKDSYAMNTSPYADDYYPSYGYYPAYPVARARAIRASFGRPVATPRAAPRGSLMR